MSKFGFNSHISEGKVTFFNLWNTDVTCREAHRGLWRWEIFLLVVYGLIKAELHKNRRQKNRRGTDHCHNTYMLFLRLSTYCKTWAPDLSCPFLGCWWEQINWEYLILISTLFLRIHTKRKIMQLYPSSTRRNLKIAIMDLTGGIAFLHSVTKIGMRKLFQWKKALKQSLSPQSFLQRSCFTPWGLQIFLFSLVSVFVATTVLIGVT